VEWDKGMAKFPTDEEARNFPDHRVARPTMSGRTIGGMPRHTTSSAATAKPQARISSRVGRLQRQPPAKRRRSGRSCHDFGVGHRGSPTELKPVRGGLTPNGDGSAHIQLGGLIEFARSTRV
jgi:hypothetical protein